MNHMDYKQVIEELRMVDAFPEECCDCNQRVKAADAIEALLAERDNLMKELHGHYDVCANKQLCYFDKNQTRECALSGMGFWKWRGTQKGVKNENL